jgi:hypothetical protein
MTTPEPGAYRKKPVVIQAMQWTGDNEAEIQAWTGAGRFHEIDPEDRGDDPDATGALLVDANSAWLTIEPGEWVLRDQAGFYPCKAAIFAATYEPAVDWTDEKLVTKVIETMSDDSGQSRANVYDPVWQAQAEHVVDLVQAPLRAEIAALHHQLADLEPRVFRAGDPLPEDVECVLDNSGDLWRTYNGGELWASLEDRFGPCTWGGLFVTTGGPVTEVRIAAPADAGEGR